MRNSTIPDKRITTMSGLGSEIGHTRPLIYEVLTTEPTNIHECPPVTKPLPDVTWKTVLLPLLDRLHELQTRPESEKWPDADWPMEEAFQDAGKFTDGLPQTMRIAPHISLADDGEVNFAWSRDGMRIDLGFYGTGTYSFYARDMGGEEWFGDDISVTSPLPKELTTLLAG